MKEALTDGFRTTQTSKGVNWSPRLTVASITNDNQARVTADSKVAFSLFGDFLRKKATKRSPPPKLRM